MTIYNSEKINLIEGQVIHSKEGFQWLQDKRKNYPEVTCILESTGVYSRQLERFLQENGYTHFILNPYEAKVKLNASLRVHKTDKADAHKLALLFFKGDFQKHDKSDCTYEQVKAMSRFYGDLMDEEDRTRNLLHHSLQLSFPGVEKLFSKLSSPFFMRIIEQFPHPEHVLTCSREVLESQIKQSTKKVISKNNVMKRAEKLISIADNCYSAVSSDHFACEQTVFYAKKLAQLLEEKERCIQRMVALAKTLPEYQVLSSVPSLGDNTTVRLISEMGDIKRFHSHKQLNAFAGIDVRRVQSGNMQMKDRINKRGNPHLRMLLFIIIQNMIRNQRHQENHMVDYYYKQKSHYNKCHKVAIVACMNKLLKTITFLIQNSTFYDYGFATNRK